MKLSIQRVTIVLAVIFSLFLNAMPALATSVGGIIDKDTQWTLANSPYIVHGNIWVQENVRLEIEPGVIVRFKTAPIQPVGYYLRVDGTLDAQGTEKQPIVFTAEDESYPWGCIVFTDSSDDWDDTTSSGCVLEHCIVEYAGTKQEASVLCVSASPLIAYNTIRHGSAGGIRTVGGYQRITSNLIHGHTFGIHLSCERGLIENNYLTDNQQGIYLDSSKYQIDIRNNTIINTGVEGGGCFNINLHYNSDPDADAAATQAREVADAGIKAQAEADAAVEKAAASGDIDAYLTAVRTAEAVAAQAKAAADAAEQAEMAAAAIAENMTAKISIDKNHILNENGNAIVITEHDPRANYEFSLTRNNIENAQGNLSILLYQWEHETPDPINMENNWWGTTNTEEIDEKIYDAKNDFYLPLADYDPLAGEAIPDAGSTLSYQPPSTDDDQIPDSPGVISKDTKWTLAESPYLVTGNMLIKENVTLEIEPGVIVRFKTPPLGSIGYYLRVDGRLKAEGTEANPILFTPEDNASPWGCIAFMDTSADWDEAASAGSVLRHCIIEYAGNIQEGGLAEFGGAAVKCFSASPLIANNTIRHSAGEGIRASGGFQRILSNLIHDTVRGIAMAAQGAVVENNYLTNNRQGIYLGEITETIDIRKNTIIGDSPETYGSCLSVSLYHHEVPSEIIISKNHIVSSAGNAIAITAQATDANDELRLASNTIENNGGNLSVYAYDWQSRALKAIDMSGNWWGTTYTREIEEMIYDAGNDFNLPRVTFQPFAIKEIPDAGSSLSYQAPDDEDEDDDIPDQAGVISSDTTWTAADSPYILTGNILVKKNVMLKIEPGVTVQFNTPPIPSVGYYLRVDGLLRAEGSQENPIRFTAQDPESPWGCIAFMDTSADWDDSLSTGSILQHCIVEYAGNSQAGASEEFGGAAIKCFSASPCIANSTIRYNTGTGIWASGGKQRITGNLIYGNSAAIVMSAEGALVENNHIRDNARGIYVGPSTDKVEINRNTIINALSEADGACLSINLYRHEDAAEIVVFRNDMTNKAGSAISMATHDPEANDHVRFTYNNMKIREQNLTVLLHDWQGEGSDPIDMAANWWGTTDTQEIDDRIYDAKNDFHLPEVRYQPIAVRRISDAGSDVEYVPPEVEPDDTPEDQPGVISQDTVWRPASDGRPRIITGNILVKKNVTLEIEPGVTLQFKTAPLESVGYYIRVDGTLRAQGTQEGPIIFTAEDIARPWGTIVFTDTSTDWDEDTLSGSVLSHCVIEHAGASQEEDMADFGGAGIKCFSASPLITDNLVRHIAGEGIWASGGNLKILSNRIHDTGRGMFLSPESGLIENNYLINNGQGMFLNSGIGEIEVRGNSILNFDEGDGIIHSSAVTQGSCMSLALYYHEEAEPEIWVHDNHIVNRAGNAIGISAQAPETNVDLRLNNNNMENTDGNLAIYLHDWSQYPLVPVNMEENWWGTSDTADIALMIYDSKNDFYLPDVNYQPVATEQIPNAWSYLPYPPLPHAGFIPPVEGNAVVPDAGADLVVDGDAVVTLDASLSFDPQHVMTYQWSQISGHPVTLSDPAAVSPTFVAPSSSGEDAILTFQLTLKDDLGFWKTDEVVIGIDESIGVKTERDKGQCFVETAIDESDINGFKFALTIIFLFGAMAGLFKSSREIGKSTGRVRICQSEPSSGEASPNRAAGRPVRTEQRGGQFEPSSGEASPN